VARKGMVGGIAQRPQQALLVVST